MGVEAEWQCPHCAEPVPAAFDLCWNCGTDRSGVLDPAFVTEVRFNPQCEACGYLLFGLTTLICPECGEPFDPKKKDTIRDLS